MLLQRLVKLALLQLIGLRIARVPERLAESVQRVDTNMAALEKSLSNATFGDLLGQVSLT